MNDVKWIKLDVDVFDNNKIKVIRSMPEGAKMLNIWFYILCIAGKTNSDGKLYIADEVPFTCELIATTFCEDINIVKMAIAWFEKLKMITVTGDVMQLSNWEKYQNIDGLEKIREQGRRRTAKYREKKKQLLLENKENEDCDVTGDVTVTHGDGTDIEEEKEYIYSSNFDSEQSTEQYKEKYSNDSVVYVLAKWMDDCIYNKYEELQLKYKHKDSKTLQKWCVTIDRMLRINGITKEEFVDVFKAVQNDEFWCKNVLSPEKFRKQWDSLNIKLEKEIKDITAQRQ